MISMENYEFVDICVFICLYSIGNHKKKYSNNSFIHILFTYSDVLTRHLVMAAVNWDKKDNFNKPPSQRSNRHVEDLVATFNSCGICFNVWEKPNADGKGSGIMDFTSLMGKDKKLLLQKLPDKLHGIIQTEGSNTIIKLWKVTYSYNVQ